MTQEEQVWAMVEVLERLLKVDSDTLYSLIQHRVPCKSSLISDPDILIRVDKDGESLSVLGLINGLLNAANIPSIAIQTPEDNPLTIQGFQKYTSD